MVHPISDAQPAALCQVGQALRFSCDKLNGHSYCELFALTKSQAGMKMLV